MRATTFAEFQIIRKAAGHIVDYRLTVCLIFK